MLPNSRQLIKTTFLLNQVNLEATLTQKTFTVTIIEGNIMIPEPPSPEIAVCYIGKLICNTVMYFDLFS